MRRRVAIPLLTVLLAGALALTGSLAHAYGASGGETAYDAEAERTPSAARSGCTSGQVTITGRGYGHGTGMSQYGAQSRARAGQTHEQILDLYYPTTTPGRVGGKIRVLITGDTDTEVVVEARPRLRLTLADRRAWSLVRQRPDAVRWRIFHNRWGRAVVQYREPGTRWLVFGRFPATSHPQVHAGGQPVELVTPSGTRPYRGALGPVDGDTVNRLRLELYLRGVLPREMPASWATEALRAQAVAARTYAARERADAPGGRHFDVYDDTRSQVYAGSSVEDPRTTAAVRDTLWKARLYDGAPAFTQFSASNGGWSVDNPNVPYLEASADQPDADLYPAWSVCVAKSKIAGTYGVGTYQDVRVHTRDGNGEWGGRALTVEIVGSTRTVTVDGTRFRFALGLRSNWFVFG